MCLAVPGKIVERSEFQGTVDLQGNRLDINLMLTPEALVGEWVLVHAGHAITTIEESEALQTWDYLREAFGDDIFGPPSEDGPQTTEGSRT